MTRRPAAPLARLYEQLKGRRVFRVVAAYVVVGWIVIEGAGTLTEILELPGWVGRSAVALVLLGLPVAVALAWAFDLTPDGLQRTAADPREPGDSPPGPAAGRGLRTARPLRRGAWFAGGFLVALLGAWLAITPPAPSSDDTVDAQRVAVMPFRVAGSDASLAYLREGVLDLLATKLTGESGLRAVDPRTLLNEWRRAADGGVDLEPDAARRVAARLGAGRVIVGEVVGTPSSLVLTASVLTTGSDRDTDPVSVTGPEDSLPALVDRLAAGLLSAGAGEASHRVATLTSASLPALRSYLQGRTATRRGDYDDARRHFELALGHDSTFALAAMGLNEAAAWLGGLRAVMDRALRLAWVHRDRLSQRDRAVLDAVAGPRYPLNFSTAEALAGWERVLELSDDRAEVWESYGDRFFHMARILETPDGETRAQTGLARAVALDSGYVGALMHLVQDAATRGDTAAVRTLARAYLGRDSASGGATFVRWRAAHSLSDSATLRRLETDSLGLDVLFWIGISGQEEGFAADEAERAARAHYRRAHTPGERQRSALALYRTLLNRGRPAEALAVSRDIEALDDDDTPILARRLLDGLYGDGDVNASADAARRLAARRAAAPATGGGVRLQDGGANTRSGLSGDCALAQWLAWTGEAASAEPLIRRLREHREHGQPLPEAMTCVTVLEAVQAVVAGAPRATARVDALDALTRQAPPTFHDLHFTMLALSQLQERLGRPERALAAVRRRIRWSPDAISTLAPMMYREARLATQLGDHHAARRAYAHYLALQDDPEPEFAPRVEMARAELARLTGEGSDQPRPRR